MTLFFIYKHLILIHVASQLEQVTIPTLKEVARDYVGI
jgi:hypothetical protein